MPFHDSAFKPNTPTVEGMRLKLGAFNSEKKYFESPPQNSDKYIEIILRRVGDACKYAIE